MTITSVNEDQNPPVPIPPPTTVDTLRTSKMKPLGNSGAESGIDKQPRQGRISVNESGLTEDEHDLTFHGGIDKAVHQYSTDNYPFWCERYPDPELQAKFVPGGFGENITATGWADTNICIGDVVRVGVPESDKVGGEYGCLLEVSLPRQPCFKVNQRFGIKNFAPKTLAAARVGWYYRVLTPGSMGAGDEVRILERPHPRWTIEKLQIYLHQEKDTKIIAELMQIPQMGEECKGNLANHLKKIRKAAEPRIVQTFRKFSLAVKKPETHRVMSLTLEAVEKSNNDAEVRLGSHINVRLPNGMSRSYSIVGGTEDRFELGILREENSRGASVYLHDVAKEGDVLECGAVTTSLDKASMASKHILIAGGIGITAFTAMVPEFEDINFSYMLHYAVPSEKDVAFKNHLDKANAKYQLYDKSKNERMNIDEIIKNRVWNSHVFVCGPQRMIDEVVRSSRAHGMSDDEVHMEAFHADNTGDPFTATVVDGEKRSKVDVDGEETLLEVLRKSGFECGSSCEAGNCGTCRVNLKAGKVEHRGNALNEQEKETSMLSCVSRGIGHIEVEL